MFRKFARAVRLIAREPERAWLLVRMASWVATLSLLVKVCTLPRALAMVSTTVREPIGGQPLRLAALATAIDAVLEIDLLAWKPNCWKRSAVLHRYCALQGVATTIIFGVQKEPGGELKGHAWLEVNGKPILESSPPTYAVTYSFPSSQPFDVDLTVMAETSRSIQ